MLFILAILTLMLGFYSVGYWSTRIYPNPRPFRYTKTPDVHLPEARQTMLHKTLASRFQLSELVLDSVNEKEKIETLLSWVHELWLPQPGRRAKSDNPVSIISRAKNGERFARSEYAIVVAHVLMAAGIPARLTTLRTRDCAWRPLSSSYAGVEYFDHDHFKWVWLDTQFGVRVLQNQTPLNALEIKDAILNDHLLDLQPDHPDVDIGDYLARLQSYLDIVVAVPIGQQRRYALIPPQLNLPKNKWWIGPAIYDSACHSIESFYASHPVKQLTRPGTTQAVNIRTGQIVSP